ncbi:MAG: uracil-DNA glycosylase [Verrucomicrobiota bacterium]
MNSQILDKTIEYVSVLQRLGKREVSLSKATLHALNHLRMARKPMEASAPHAQKLELAPSTGNKEKDLAALRERAMVCVKCPHLARTRKQVVFGVGNPNTEIMFVGEAPGADEDEQGEPFVGAAGKLLTKMIEAMGLTRQQIYIGNVLKCRPDMPAGSSGNRKPTHKEMETCLPYLRAQIAIIKPKVIVALGATALQGLTGNPKAAMSKVRGIWQEFEGIPFMPTYHPAYLLYDQSISNKRIVWEDLLKVMERTAMPISEKQKNFFLKAL